jgi:hypothetical protein
MAVMAAATLGRPIFWDAGWRPLESAWQRFADARGWGAAGGPAGLMLAGQIAGAIMVVAGLLASWAGRGRKPPRHTASAS